MPSRRGSGGSQALAERLLEPGGVGRRDRRGVERPEPLPQLERAGERGLHRDLLVEREPDQQGKRVARDERVASGSPVKWSSSGAIESIVRKLKCGSLSAADPFPFGQRLMAANAWLDPGSG